MEKSVEEWTRRAEMALKSGDENLAREALSVKKEKEIQTAKLTEQVQMLSEASEKFQSSLKLYQSKVCGPQERKVEGKKTSAQGSKGLFLTIETIFYAGKIEEAKGETASYASRALAAKTVKTVNEMASGVGESSAATFEKMKEKVEAMEINAEVTAESLPAGADPGLNAKFRALESDDVDDELEKMKRRLEAGQ